MRQQPKQARSRLMVDSLVDGAIQVLGEQGAAGTTTTLVAQRAGVSIGSLYQYFADKDALLDAVVDRMCGDVSQLLASEFSTRIGQDVPAVARGLLEAILDYVELHRRLIAELGEDRRRTARATRALERGFLDPFRMYLIEHHREISTRKLASASYVVFTSVAFTCLRLSSNHPPGVNREDVLDVMVDMVTACLTRRE